MTSTVTIGKSYLDALLRRAEFYTSGPDADTTLLTSSLSSTVTIAKAEYDHLLQASSEYNLLKSALFRGGLTKETLDTLLAEESGTNHEDRTQNNVKNWDEPFVKPHPVPVTVSAPRPHGPMHAADNTAAGDRLVSRTPSHSCNRAHSFGHPDSLELPDKDTEQGTCYQRPTAQELRTVLISNLSDRTTHKDIVEVIRGGRLLDVFLRNDRSAAVSFVEGAQDFMAYAKKNDIYLHMKRLEIRWNDRQFHVPAHVSNKIANGATRNIVVRSAATRQLTPTVIRDHLDHIHNLFVVDIKMNNGDAYISTNSIHNCLFARTCMMSRTEYKGLRIDWYPDECARPVPHRVTRMPTPSQCLPSNAAQLTNRYTVLDPDASDTGSDHTNESFLTSGIHVSNWADAVA